MKQVYRIKLERVLSRVKKRAWNNPEPNNCPATLIEDSIKLVEELRSQKGICINIFHQVVFPERKWTFVVSAEYLDCKMFYAEKTQNLPVAISQCALRAMWQLIDKTKKRTPK